MMNTLDPIHRAFDAVDVRLLLVQRPILPATVTLPSARLKARAIQCLRLEDMADDIKRLGIAVARNYVDQSCVMLHQEDLESEARCALVNVLEKGWLERSHSRQEFFKVLKSAMANRMRSLVQKERFTQKRTGIKPPPKHERNRLTSMEHTKPIEISLDDPNAHLQVGEEERGLHEDDYDTKELTNEIRKRCDWATRAVFEQLIEPCLEAWLLAELDSKRGPKSKQLKVEMTHDHIILAANGTITREGWDNAVLRIQQITQRLRDMNPDDQRYEEIIVFLSQIFQLQVPKTLDQMIVRRMLTVAARDNWGKVTPEIEQLLGNIGAVGPKFNAQGEMNCFGVLYQRGHKLCESCGVKISCSTQAANVGLGDITLHPKLLGAKLSRTPYVVGNPASAQAPLTGSKRESDILDYLRRNFKPVTHMGEVYFQPKDFKDKQKMIFCVGDRVIPFRLRFCSPDPLLRKKLAYVNKCYYAPEDASSDQVISFINLHAKMAYA